MAHVLSRNQVKHQKAFFLEFMLGWVDFAIVVQVTVHWSGPDFCSAITGRLARFLDKNLSLSIELSFAVQYINLDIKYFLGCPVTKGI